MNIVNVGGVPVGDGYPCFIIAEIGINHNGNIETAQKMIDAATEAGADAVKFQTRTVDAVYTPEELAKPRQVPRSILENAVSRGVLSGASIQRLERSGYEDSTNGDLKRALEFTEKEYWQIDSYCKKRGIMWLTSCWDLPSFVRMEQFNLPCLKIASACNEDDELLTAAQSSGKPTIISTGMTDLDGVRAAVKVFGKANLIILHCTSVYPKGTESGNELLAMVNLRGIDTLAGEFDVPVGFSSHYSGIMPVYAAVARGACVIETHITLERGMFGSDQASSLEPNQFRTLFQTVKQLHVALGDGKIVIYPGELEVAQKLRRVRRTKQPEVGKAWFSRPPA